MSTTVPALRCRRVSNIARRHLALFVDAKKVWVGADARGLAATPTGYMPATAHLILNPVIWNTGVSYHF